MERRSNSDLKLPPGFRFHPSDEELIMHYLKNKATSSPLPASIIAEVELYKFNPWELPKKALFGDEEWYFFTPRDRKYPNGVRPNRMAASGYWKATGTDKPIFSSCGAKIIGVKKALVFYKGRPPRGAKTDWIMDEYRVLETMIWSSKKKGSMRLDDWVLCRVRQKSSTPRNNWEDWRGLGNEAVGYFPRVDKPSSTPTNPNLEMLGDSLFKDCPMLPFIFGSQLEFPCINTGSSISFEDSRTSPSVCDDYIYQESLLVSPPPCNSIFNTKKRKPVESNPQENPLQSNKKVNKRDQKEEVVCLSNNTTNMNFNSTADQYATNGFNTDQWNFMMQYQELNHMAFT
ncbi:hypothetical protein RJ640_007204 [Escallonia rubra]|uniref:NAC domain-containing protein n=1 Tax=Escallonia rubra TaxID=112253 RepID=A0AA88QS88_9ASTE|nr:hypothetical protein RJ640_007204 [Escallonia rubra]